MLVLAACRSDGGVPGNPIGMRLQWFSFLDGDGFRDQCTVADPDRYRMIFNARFEEQVRVYDVTRYGEGAIMRARAVTPGIVLSFAGQGLNFRWRESKAELSPAEFSQFRRRLEESAVFEPTPVGLELFSPDFYWIVMSCEEGVFHYTAFARPSPAFEALTFPEFLFERDETGVAVNPPRAIPTSERLRATGGGIGRNDSRHPAFRMVVDENGLSGRYGLF